MAGLSDIHLFTGWELNCNPINMRISDTLETSLKDKPFNFKPSSEPQCGTLSMKLDKTQWNNVIKTLKEQSDLLELRRYKAEELSKEINQYLERKCEEYCEKNDINFISWSHFAYSEHRRNFWEVKYKGELVCGAKVICELIEGATEASVKLELY